MPDPRGAASVTLDTCPRRDEHTPHPTGYFAHAEWAEKMLRTHHQVRCPGCKRWAIWVAGVKS